MELATTQAACISYGDDMTINEESFTCIEEVGH